MINKIQKSIYPPGIYIVATPIGNLMDITYRAVDTLNNVDLVLCEDTRVSQVLMRHYNISTPSTSLHDFNEDKKVDHFIKLVISGKRLALISDAGTPLISDPGYKLIRAAQEHQLYITSIPGPVALINALVLSGLPNHKFFFGGFIASKLAEQKRQFQELTLVPATLIFYETANRLLKTLEVIHQIFGSRKVSVCREMTKKFEHVFLGTAQEVGQFYLTAPLKGEIVLLISPPDPASLAWKEDDLDMSILQALASPLSLKDIVDEISSNLNVPRTTVYQRALFHRAHRAKHDSSK